MEKDEQIYKTFISRHLKEKHFENKIHVKILRVKSKTNEDTFGAKFELDNLKTDSSNVKADKSKYGPKFYESESGGRLHEVSGSRNNLDQNFYMDDNVDQQKNNSLTKSKKKVGNIVQLKLKLEIF